MQRAAEQGDWSEFFAAQAGREPREFFRDVMARVGDGEGRVAVDLGCGDGTETRWLLDRGWSVTAVDASSPGLDLLRARVLDDEPLVVVQARVEDVVLPSSSLVYSGFTVPYCPPERFPAMWQRIRDSLLPGGWLAVNLFGDRDTWATEFEDMNFHTEGDARALFDGLEVVAFGIREEDGPSGWGPKHWHVYDVLARRSPG